MCSCSPGLVAGQNCFSGAALRRTFLPGATQSACYNLATMDIIGLLAAWVGVVSFLLAVLIAIVVNLLTPGVQQLWAQTSRNRTEKRLHKLLNDLERCKTQPDN